MGNNRRKRRVSRGGAEQRGPRERPGTSGATAVSETTADHPASPARDEVATGEDTSATAPWRRRAHNLLIAAIVVVISIDALPNSIPGVGRLDRTLNPLLNVLGIYQAQWTLFAPSPDNVNSWIEAKILYSDGTLQLWSTPDWQDRTLADKWLQGRHPKFANVFFGDSYKSVWPHLASYVLRTHPPPPGAQAEQIMLIRHWWDIPKPDDAEAERSKYEHYPPRRAEFPEKYVFYNERLR